MGRRRAGFTLLETIVALSIVALIAAAITTALRLASGSIERGEEETRETARLRAGIGILERTIRSADRAPLPGPDGPAPYFLGEPGRVRFLGALPVSAGEGGCFRLLSFGEAENGDPAPGLAVAEASPFRLDGAFGWEGRDGSAILLPGASEVAFSYSPGPSPEGRWEWADRWDSREEGGLPAAVRVSFTLRRGERPLRTAFVVPVMAGGVR
ncbi:MAG: hypothetical protein Kow00128_22240 [Deltaproteobacteria bacterium]